MTPDDPFEGGTSYVDKAIEQARETKGGTVMAKDKIWKVPQSDFDKLGVLVDILGEQKRNLEKENIKLRDEVERYRLDLEAAAGECIVECPKPGTDMAKLLIANRLMRADAEAGRRLPLTADGVRVVLGEKYWRLCGVECEHLITGMTLPDDDGFCTVYFDGGGFSVLWRWDESYSTLEALRAATESEVKG